MNNETVKQIASAANVSEKTAQNWMRMILAQLPDKLDAGKTMDEAMSEIYDETQELFAELIAGESPKARVYRSWIAAQTYAELGGLEYDAGRDGTPTEYAALSVLNDPELADIDRLILERGVQFLAGL